MSTSTPLYCPIRKEWVAALPEEFVRQRVLQHMIQDLGFPCALIAVEKAIKHLPHLSLTPLKNIPDRRVDIICFAKQAEGARSLFPLLTIECKAIPLNPRVINQVLGYNHFICSRYVAIVNQQEIKLGWRESNEQDFSFIDFIPKYADLC